MNIKHGQDGHDANELNDHEKGGGTYALMRDCNASVRLTAQHFLWKDLLGYLLHPDIPMQSSNLKIADVATGNGIWLQDLACHAPQSAEFHGFDISLDQVGHRSWLPANIHMHTWDVFEEPPPRFCQYFDVVHVRLLTVVIKNNDPVQVLSNLTKLLKPEGFLQWGEVESIGYSIKTVPGGSGEKLDELISQIREHDIWKHQMPEIMSQNQYDEVSMYNYEYGLGMARFWNDMYVSAWKEFAQTVLKTPEQSDELETKAMAEAREGAAIMVPKLVWVGRKQL